jgi:hypothetical protein
VQSPAAIQSSGLGSPTQSQKRQALARHCAGNALLDRQVQRPALQAFPNGRYWARTSDPQLVDPIAGVTSVSVLFGLVRSNPLAERVSGRLRAIDVKRPNTLYRTFRHCTGTAPVSRTENTKSTGPDLRLQLGRHQATGRSPRSATFHRHL